jgi:CHASE2 domain-containing sensor protein/signal transduction histidine kinase
VTSTPQARQARWQREWFGVSALLTALALVLGATSCTWRLDQAVYDSGLSLWPQPSPQDIVMVTIDEDSLRQLGRWPWPRAVHATLIERLSAAQPKAILLDLLLSEPDPDPRQDQALALALQKSGKVVLPLSFEAAPMQPLRELQAVAPLRAQARQAHADAALDVDGVLRWAPLQAGIAPHQHPHMALALLQAAGEAMHPAVQPQHAPSPSASSAPLGASPTWLRDERVLIRYAGPPGTMRRVSFAAVLRGEVPPDAFKGKYVLIGATAIGLGDWYQTPVSGLSQSMPSVEITANLLNMLRTGSWIRPVSPLGVGLVSAGLILMLMLAFVRLTPRQALLATLGSAVVLGLASCALLAAGLWLPPTTYMLTALLAYPVWSWRRLEAANQFLDEEILRLDAPPNAALDVVSAPAPADLLERRITAIREANARLEQSRQLLVDTLTAMPEAVLVLDTQGLVHQANPQAHALLKHSAKLPGQAIDHLLAVWLPTDAPRWPMLLERALAENRIITTEAHGPDDQHALARIAPLPAHAGQDRWVVLCLADITPIRLIEQQRDDLLGFIAHDIRSPQASLVSLVQLQKMNPSAMDEAEILHHVDTLARSTLALCDELLQIMRAEKRPMQLHPTPLADIARQALNEVDLQARAKDIRLVKDWPLELAPILPLDPSLMRRALVNLLNNAIKFSPHGSAVVVGLERRQQCWVVSITDQGPGIAPSELKKLFRRYERLESSTAARVTAGVGLGLVFIDTVARRHGGRVEIHSEERKGSRFELWLPSP